jgi:hypothetical protein
LIFLTGEDSSFDYQKCPLLGSALFFSSDSSLFFVIDAQITVLADALCIQESITVFTVVGLLYPPFVVVAVFAHSIRIVVLSLVGAF